MTPSWPYRSPEIMLAALSSRRITSAQDASLALSRSFRKRPGKAGPSTDPRPEGALAEPGSGDGGAVTRAGRWTWVGGGLDLRP